MIINGMEFYPELLDEIRQQSLVVFVGAGVSMAKPTNFPSYKELVRKVLSMKGRALDEEKQLDVQIGELERNGVDIHRIVADEFQKKGVKSNTLHRDILTLFRNAKNVRIVTTNYDNMFEKAAKRLRLGKVQVYNAPAMPDPNDFSGIVHLHGNCLYPKHMVVTDTDFGKAYLSNGYATRFVLELFANSNVLFIGYSYEDIMMAYLTKAIAVKNKNHVYAITNQRKKDWPALGINPIFYDAPNHDHSQMYIGMTRLSDHCSRQLVDFEERIKLLTNDDPPIDDEENSFLLEMCRKETTLHILLDNISSDKWLRWLYNNKCLLQLFQTKRELDDCGKRLATWIAHNHFDKSLISLIADNGCVYNHTAMNYLFSDLTNTDGTSLRMMVFTMLPFLDEPYTLNLLLASLTKREEEYLSYLVLRKLITVEYTISKRLSVLKIGGETSCEMQRILPFAMDLEERWKNYKNTFMKIKYYQNLVGFLTCQIEDLYETVATINDRTVISTFELESSYSIAMSEQHVVQTLCNMLHDSLELTENKSFMLSWIKKQIHSERSLLRRVAIATLRQNSCFSPNERIQNALNLRSLITPFEKEELFLLLAENAEKSSILLQKRLVHKICSIRLRKKQPDSSEYYSKYNIIQWMKQKCPATEDISLLLEEEKRILAVFPFFKPRSHPEKDIEIEGFSWSADKENNKIQTILLQSLLATNKMFESLTEKKEELLQEGTYYVELAARKDVRWALSALAETITNSTLEKYISSILRGIKNSADGAAIKESLTLLSEYNTAKEVCQELCDLLITYVEVKNDLDISEADWILGYVKHLWMYREAEVYEMDDCFQISINSVPGKIARVLILLLRNDSSERILSVIKSFAKDDDVYYCTVLLGFAPTLFHLDPVWTKDSLLPKLDIVDENRFEYFWSGITYFSSHIYREYAAQVKEYCDSNLTRIKKLKSVLDRFMSLYGILIVYISEKPCDDAIAACNEIDQQHRLHLLSSIKRQIKIMNDETTHKAWISWLHQFIKLRFSNIPESLDKKELEQYVEWTLYVSTKDFGTFIDMITSNTRFAIDSYYLLPEDFTKNENYIEHSHDAIKMFCWLDKCGANVLFFKEALVGLRKKWIENKIDEKDLKMLDSLIRKA